MQRRHTWLGSIVLAMSVATGSSLGAGDEIIVGTVTASDDSAVRDARVTVLELSRSAHVDEQGSFRFEGIPAGTYHVEAVSRGLGSTVEEVEVGGGETRVSLRLELSPHSEKVVVTATRSGRGAGEVAQPVQVMDVNALSERMEPTLGETLAQEPGVSSTYYGPGASRPIVRGKGGGRIRVLEGGLGVGDASTTSPDHAVGTDMMSANRVEILRGPSTLLYGGTAVGGVINVMDERIPEFAPHKPIGGKLDLRLASVSDEKAGGVNLGGGTGPIAFHIDALKRETDDYAIPGPAVRGDPSTATGTLSNSSLESEGGTLGVSWVGEKGFVGIAAKRFDSNYGIPAGTEAIRIDLGQKRYDLRGGFDTSWGRFKAVRFSAGAADYRHQELEGAQVGTTFTSDSFEGRVELHHGEGGTLPGVIGIQGGSRDLEAIGDEAFLPPSTTDAAALFAVQEFKPEGPLDYEFGLRWEMQDTGARNICEDGTECRNDADCAGIGGGECTIHPDRSFDVLSTSIGLAWLPSPTYTLGLSATRAVRPPSAEELYSDGPHLATASFERGDPTLDEETSLGVDLTLRKREGRVTGEISLYANRYDDFILELPTGEVEDGLPVFQFGRTDATFVGFELEGVVGLLHRGDHDFDLELSSDYVKTEDLGNGGELPFIPPLRAGLGLRYLGGPWEASARAQYVADADRQIVTALDSGFLTTPSYTMLGATLSYRLVASGLVHRFMLRGTNLTDVEGRNQSSRLRDLVPLPGRDLSVVYGLVF